MFYNVVTPFVFQGRLRSWRAPAGEEEAAPVG